jgi:hypothetical protein
METMEQATTVHAGQDGAFDHLCRRNNRAELFNPEQQQAFDKAFRKREAKIHREYESMLRDLRDTVEVTQHLLERCKDRIGLEDECLIRDGLQAIHDEYSEDKWQKRQR